VLCKFVWYEILQMFGYKKWFLSCRTGNVDNLTVIGFSWGENNSSNLQSGSLNWVLINQSNKFHQQEILDNIDTYQRSSKVVLSSFEYIPLHKGLLQWIFFIVGNVVLSLCPGKTYNPEAVSMYALLNPELRLKDNLAWLQYFRNSVVLKIFKHIPLW